jgi:hypothetical protein
MAKTPVDPALVKRRETLRQAKQALEDCKGLPLDLKGTLLICLGKMNEHAGNVSWFSYETLAELIKRSRRVAIHRMDVLEAVGAVYRKYKDREYGRSQILAEHPDAPIAPGDNIALNYWTFNPDWPGFNRQELPEDMLELVSMMAKLRHPKVPNRDLLKHQIEKLRKRFQVVTLNGRPSDGAVTINSDGAVTRTVNSSYEDLTSPKENKSSALSSRSSEPEQSFSPIAGVEVPSPVETDPDTLEVRAQLAEFLEPESTLAPARRLPTRPSGSSGTGRLGSRPAATVQRKAKESPPEPPEFLEFVEHWNRWAEKWLSMTPATPDSKMRAALLVLWQDSAGFCEKENWLRFLAHIGNNPVLRGEKELDRTAKQNGKTVVVSSKRWKIEAGMLFRLYRDTYKPGWRVIADGEFNSSSDRPAPVDARIGRAFKEYHRNEQIIQSSRTFKGFLEMTGGHMLTSGIRIYPSEFDLAELVAARLEVPVFNQPVITPYKEPEPVEDEHDGVSLLEHIFS